MATTKTNIYDSKNKTNLTGYIKDGKTYTDDGKRISAGMQVTDDKGNTWEMGADGKGALVGSIVGNTSSGGSSSSSSVKTKTADETSYLTDIQKAFEAKNKALQDGLTTQLGTIKQSSDDNRSNAYVSSRLSAIGNNEQLASQGLAGELYGSPMSGKSETSRIAENVALGNNINSINRQQTDLENQAKNAVLTASADNQLQMAQTIAQLRQQEREVAKADLATAKAEYAQNVGQYYDDFQAEKNKILNDNDPSNDWKADILGAARQNKISTQAQLQTAAQQQDFENQLKAMETMYAVSKPYYKAGSGGSSGGYSGLTAAQAQTAYNNGIRTPEVLAAMAHHFGVTEDKVVLEKPTLTASEAKKAFEEGSNSKNVNYAMLYYYGESGNKKYTELTKKISNMNNDGKRSWIQYYNQNGKITDDEAKYLLAQNGII